jgi:hypothetical protein
MADIRSGPFMLCGKVTGIPKYREQTVAEKWIGAVEGSTEITLLSFERMPASIRA